MNKSAARRRRLFGIPIRVIAPLLALLTFVGPLHIITLPTGGGQVKAQFEICSPSAQYEFVVQDCLLRGNGFGALEQQAIDDLLAAHQLPEGDRSRLIGWERDAIRAAVFTSLVAIIEKDPAERSTTEQDIVDSMAELVRQRRIDAAQFSIDQYNIWDGNPCEYAPPAPYEYEIPTT